MQSGSRRSHSHAGRRQERPACAGHGRNGGNQDRPTTRHWLIREDEPIGDLVCSLESVSP